MARTRKQAAAARASSSSSSSPSSSDGETNPSKPVNKPIKSLADPSPTTYHHDARRGSLPDLLSARASLDRDEKLGRVTLLDLLRVLAGLLLLSTLGSYMVTGDSLTWGLNPWFLRPSAVSAWWKGPVEITEEELWRYNGTDPSLPIYVGLNGSVYDVSANRMTYGPGGSYNFFTGKDAARAFVTGCFREDQTPDLRGVEEMFIPVEDLEGEEEISKAELKMRRERERREARKRVEETIERWAKLFRGDGGKDYFFVGRIKREEGWLENLPKRELCERAQKSRPMRSQLKEAEAAEAAQAV